MARCGVCFRHCEIKEGGTGFCGARTCREGVITASNYGCITSIALDPIEKKPLARFFPGSMIVSVGSYGCNLRCPFCQNHDISWSESAMAYGGPDRDELEMITPEQLCRIAKEHERYGNIGVAFTYNEPLIGYEFVRDTARLVSEAGMKNVLVSNGTATTEVLEEILPFIDAMNIDIKGFTDEYYRDVLGGNREMVMDFITRAVWDCHVELTMLVVPGENDGEDEMRRLTEWIAALKDREGNTVGRDIPLHVSRFFPRFKMTDREATNVRSVYRLAEVARERLNYVYTGNC